jgi:hypothetical protein
MDFPSAAAEFYLTIRIAAIQVRAYAIIGAHGRKKNGTHRERCCATKQRARFQEFNHRPLVFADLAYWPGAMMLPLVD